MLQRTTRRSALRANASPRTALAVTSLLAIACSAPPGLDDADGPPEFSGSIPAAGQGPTPAAPVNTASPGNAAGPAPSAPASAANAAEQNPAAGAPIAPSAQPPSGSQSGANASADANQGAGGSSMTPPGGEEAPPPVTQPPADQQPPAPQPEQPPQGAPEVTPPAPPPPPAEPAGPDIPCPPDATFCSGFEGIDLPAGSNFVIGGDSSFPNQFALDSSQARSGQQSFAIPGPSPGFSYRALAIPAPGQDFWARLYVRLGSEFGDENHDSLFGASNANLTSDHNNETLIELSEQFGYVLLNTDDCTLACNSPSPQLKLAADTWHCLEAHYDGNSGRVEVFLEGEQFIDATNPSHQLTFQTFRLGYMRFNTERSVWYDDVVLATSRVGCD